MLRLNRQEIEIGHCILYYILVDCRMFCVLIYTLRLCLTISMWCYQDFWHIKSWIFNIKNEIFNREQNIWEAMIKYNYLQNRAYVNEINDKTLYFIFIMIMLECKNILTFHYNILFTCNINPSLIKLCSNINYSRLMHI